MNSYLKIVLSMLIWSTWGVMIRWMELPPVVILFYISLIAGVSVPLVLNIRGEFSLSGIAGTWPYFAVLAAASIANNITYFYALGHTTVSNAVFTHYTAPIFVAVLAPLLINEPIHRSTILSLPLAVGGMALIIYANGGLNFGSEHMPGILAGTASGVAYAFLILLSRKLSRMLMHHKAVIFILWITTIATAPFALGSNYLLTPLAIGLLLVGGLLHSTIAPLLYYSALRKVIAQHAAILGYIEPLAAIPLAFVFFSETPPLLILAGGLLIVFSGYFVIRSASGKLD
ncbi:MAG: DMT family transporter [Nitrospirota bacterium]|nr:DMT family transporter [Nitrospirota bacterium]